MAITSLPASLLAETLSERNQYANGKKQPLRILTWEGYVTETELKEVNQLLSDKGYPYTAELVKPYAEGAQQMFDLIRGQKCDVAFLTLFFIKMENEQTSTLLQAINTQSPRLTNYKELRKSLTHLPMGLNEAREPLYIPWGGGAYGFYVDRNKVAEQNVPKSVSELWLPKWKNKFSLNESQPWYNLGLALMTMGASPFALHNLALSDRRNEIVNMIRSGGELQHKTNTLYQNAGHLWAASPTFKPKLEIVSSWGPEISHENKQGGNWQKINFKEGDMVWLDTINFVKGMNGLKLEASEIFANYFIGKKVQSRIGRELSMVAASSKVEVNKTLGDADKLFSNGLFVPPYDAISYSVIKRMTDKAINSIK